MKVADGPPQRIGHLGQKHLPGEEVWLVGEHRSTGERKYYLSNLPADTPLRKLAAPSKPGGYASKPISSSRKGIASITSRGDHGKAYTAMPS